MKIAVLGWGSLIWDHRDLCICSEIWLTDGPFLPVEFARKSKDGRLTLVLLEGAKEIPVLWNFIKCSSLEDACENLRKREGNPGIDSIGYIEAVSAKSVSNSLRAVAIIRPWAQAKNIDMVIWTDLPANFKKETGKDFTDENIISYLQALPQDKKDKAKEYIIKTPSQIRTKMREVIEKKLGWTCISEI